MLPMEGTVRIEFAGEHVDDEAEAMRKGGIPVIKI
jgi:hypothetical protein